MVDGPMQIAKPMPIQDGVAGGARISMALMRRVRDAGNRPDFPGHFASLAAAVP